MAELVSAASRYDELNGERSSVTDRAELCAELTIPYLFREDGASATDDLERKYTQGYGAKLVNHLVGKFALSILPPSQPFYRLSATQEAMEAITQGDEAAAFEIEKVLATQEEGILRYINKSRFRSSLYPALRLAMVTGDSLVEKIVSNGSYRVFNMRNYVIKRDAAGNILDLIIKEVLDFDAVPEEIRNTIPDEKKEDEVNLYTRVRLEEKVYKINQEINEEIVSGSEEEIDNISDRFISIRWNKVDGEDYGRSFIEEYLGTMIALEKQSQVINESAIVASKTIFTVNPNGMTKYEDFVDAANGDVIIGQETDVGTIKTNKHVDMQVTHAIVQEYKKELAEAFLLGSAAIRDAERVTAHEVQMVASELEASFGGIYTAIAEDIQMPLIENAMKTLKIDGGDDIDIIVTAGVEALGRNIELSKINSLIQELGMLGQLVGQEAVAKTVNVAAMTSAMVANSGVASKNFLYSKPQMDQAEMAAREEAIGKEALAPAMQQLGAGGMQQLMEGE